MIRLAATKSIVRFLLALAMVSSIAGFCGRAFAADSAAAGSAQPLAVAQPVISARSPEVLASYRKAPQAEATFRATGTPVAEFCADLLATQLRMHGETDSWKMYSLYEVLDRRHMMTAPLVRVPTVTELSVSIPKYTTYRVTATSAGGPGSARLSALADGSIVIADKGTQCGPDPLSAVKGAYFVKCGSYWVGSGLIETRDLAKASCRNVRVLSAD